MKKRIQDELRRIERNDDVRVLLAVESGSRAWGFASTDSDWDVRFVYLRRSEWYLTVHHYLHMAEGNYRSSLRGERVRQKKYFYVLRPVLACQWIEARGSFPPMEFERLLDAQVRDPEVLQAVRELLEKKRAGAELDDGPRVPVLNDFLEERLAHFQAHVADAPRGQVPSLETLDAVFRAALRETWGPNSIPGGTGVEAE